MENKRSLTPEEISAIVDGLNPINWTQMELLAKMPEVDQKTLHG